MISIITSAIAGVLIVTFLGYYAVTLSRAPLSIVIIAVLGMLIADFVLTVRDEKRRQNEVKE
ncbi:MAG: hypothetical protein GWN84_19265 [Gammaproteobacteria bacterium]|nr:hypothetical protein [Gammaproteobacteria bacterium]NIR84968.1 hypothetical protein [Gammaproteobacteria bacterium]NIR91817.1 hypothetical protein [Gammaproteobacteria bacterium]NIU06015.1 hypothetical protein [Gammaproteobacteria bacterium]NIV53062.1 hypothetical protein [Gammaproteobacteria bacterium]